MIVNIRGTHGSGKSTILARLLKEHAHEEVLDENGKLLGYRIPKWNGKRRALYVFGPYRTACGGCDAIQPYDLIWPRIESWASNHVIFEGALVSSSVGNIGRAMAARKDCVVLFLNTPLQVCLDRIAERRAARGDVRPLDPKNTTSKFEGIERSKPKMKALGLDCRELDYKKAYQQVLEVLREG